MKKIHTAINLPDATRVHALLEAAGIPCFVLNQYAAGALGEIPVDQTRPQVWIADPAHAARANALIQESNKPLAGGPWKCPHCAEANPAEFELCWQCGTEHP